MADVTDTDIISWIKEFMKNENFADYDIKLLGKSEKGGGYNSEIVFANVFGTIEKNQPKELNLAIKFSKPTERLTELTPAKSMFETEIHFYDKIIPMFRKLQEENEISVIFDAVPKCYKTMLLDNTEVIILENLKKKGFELYDRKKPLSVDHQKKVLREYGKFHALSFALKDKKPELFNSLTNHCNLAKELYKDEAIKDSFQTALEQAMLMFNERNEFLLVEKITKTLVKGAGDILSDFMNEDISEVVFTHGDCWNNNYMYKYQDTNRTSPSEVIMLDWQMVGLRSPVFDLSHFIYATSSKEQLDYFEELMEVYYTSFSSFLGELDCDPNKLFPFSTLKAHWKRYALYGLLYIPLILKFILCDPDKLPETDDFQAHQASSFKLASKENDVYCNRLKYAFTHFFEFEFSTK